MNIIHTTRYEIGQIYVPFVNWTLAMATLAAVIGFGSSDALALPSRRLTASLVE
jgi:KUP system potassium uptake protein